MKLFSAFTALAIAAIAFSPAAQAGKVKYSASQFTSALKTKVGTKKGPSAYNAAASLLKSALSGDPSNKKLVVSYAKAILKVCNKKVVADPLAGKSRSAYMKALTSYFTGLAYNPMDSKFVAAMKVFSGKLPISQQTQAIAQLIASPILAFNTKKGGSQSDINFINSTVYTAAGTTPPTPPS